MGWFKKKKNIQLIQVDKSMDGKIETYFKIEVDGVFVGMNKSKEEAEIIFEFMIKTNGVHRIDTVLKTKTV